DGRVATRSIIKAFDVSKDITSGFLTCCIMLVMDEFGFERVEEALHRSVVIAIGPAAHRSPKAGGLHHLAILRRGVLNATIWNGESSRHQAAVSQWPSLRPPMAV